MRVDLHCHSTASDGLLSPSALVQRAQQKGVELLALTDHDSIAGLSEAQRTAVDLGLRLVSGVEASCLWQGATLHVLGYGFDVQSAVLQSALASIHQARWQRAEEIDRRLAARGMPGTLDGARALQQRTGASDNAPGRPHFAEYLLSQGYVRSHREAFQKWLGAGKLGDVNQHWPSLEETMVTLGQAGAWISLAHPLSYPLTRSKRRCLVSEFVALGGHALEVANGLQPAEQVGQMVTLCREFRLKASVGSDFHRPDSFAELGLYRQPPADLPMLWEAFGQAPGQSTDMRYNW